MVGIEHNEICLSHRWTETLNRNFDLLKKLRRSDSSFRDAHVRFAQN